MYSRTYGRASVRTFEFDVAAVISTVGPTLPDCRSTRDRSSRLSNGPRIATRGRRERLWKTHTFVDFEPAEHSDQKFASASAIHGRP